MLQRFGMEEWECGVFWAVISFVFTKKAQIYFVFKACKWACLHFVVQFTRSLCFKSPILSMIDKRARHQMYSISCSVSESTPVLLTPSPVSAPVKLVAVLLFTPAGLGFHLCVLGRSLQ